MYGRSRVRSEENWHSEAPNDEVATRKPTDDSQSTATQRTLTTPLPQPTNHPPAPPHHKSHNGPRRTLQRHNITPLYNDDDDATTITTKTETSTTIDDNYNGHEDFNDYRRQRLPPPRRYDA